MQTIIRDCEFSAVDGSGKSHTIIGQREDVVAIGNAIREGVWHFRTADGKEVRFKDFSMTYLILESKTRLVSHDPRQPKEYHRPDVA